LIQKATTTIVEIAVHATVELTKRQLLQSELGTTAVLLTELATGTGPQHRFFDENHSFTKALMQSSKLEEVRDYFYAKLASIGEKQMEIQGVTNWGADFTPLDVPTTYTLAEQFVGSFDVEVKYNAETKLLTFTMTNETSLQSAGYRLMTSHSRSQEKQYGTIKQTCVVTEMLDTERLREAKQESKTEDDND
jgi:hypothetical protein